MFKTVRETITRHNLLPAGSTVVVGVSGGPDSLCLLHLLKRLQNEGGFALHVAHLNHQLRGAEADADAAFVAALATAWSLPVTVEARDVAAHARASKISVEEAAREARYAFLADVAARAGADRVAVAHHADDQVETVLMHALRGAGLAGLRGMLPDSPYPVRGSDLRLVRPLLEATRAEIEAYCAAHDLQPRFDRSNLDTTIFRNRLRHEVIPYLETINPNIRRVLRHTAAGLADDYAFLRQAVNEAWDAVAREEDEAILFARDGWRALHPSLQRGLIRKAVRRLRPDLKDINWVHVEPARRLAMEKPPGKQATLPAGLTLFHERDSLVIAERLPLPDGPFLQPGQDVPVALPARVALPGGRWQLLAEIVARDDLQAHPRTNVDRWQAFLDAAAAGPRLSLRTRRPGDRFQPLGMKGHMTLGEFFIAQKVPVRLRDRIPLLVSGGRIIWVAGHRLDEAAKVTETTKKVLWVRLLPGE
ncbi:MAG: tRNA lysidine(34) synthetase TilS [Chloroflexi bacterium]|nr:tRNA lysidine(34) synthetase TilS [Chloroflexota bacterium]